jgi:thiopurine S-methyltransferase
MGEILKSEFWHDRWKQGQTDFHNPEVNPRLVEYWPGIGIEPEAAVFVPLCGKSLDLHWLEQRGHPVIGIELSPIAVGEFFTDSGTSPTRSSSGSLELFSADRLDIYCGNFFDPVPEQLATTRACYDRGSIVALPSDLRVRYAEHLTKILPSVMTILMLILEYDQSEMSGPPHSVPPEEVERLFGGEFEIETLWSSGWVDASPRLKRRGLETRQDHVLWLHREMSESPRQ